MASTLKIYSMVRPNEAVEGVENATWEDVCHSRQAFLFIAHEATRWVSRHTVAENKRPFIVHYRRFRGVGYIKIGSSKTYAGAVKIAKRLSRELAWI